MNKIKIKDPKKFARGIAILLVPIVLLIFLLSIRKRPEKINEELFTTNENYKDITIYKGRFLDLDLQLPENLQTSEPRSIAYPEDGVRGVYLSAVGVTTPDIFNPVIEMIEGGNLNAVVIDYKDDMGIIRGAKSSENKNLQSASEPLYQKSLLDTLHEKNIYSIARIVAFKDRTASQAHPERALHYADGSLWTSEGGDHYLNPFLKENWDYLIQVAISAAKDGFDEIQFDYVRFPENFNYISTQLEIPMGDYASLEIEDAEKRSRVIADFLGYARSKMVDFHMKVSADIFGYITVSVDDGNVGQNFVQIAENVDVISSMIYPSHWAYGSFDIDKPDLDPAGVVRGYMDKELAILGNMEKPPITRPWLQDFTASYLGGGNYQTYDTAQVQAQIDALAEKGVREYLLWDPSNVYSKGVKH